jgi:hypothetical protein
VQQPPAVEPAQSPEGGQPDSRAAAEVGSPGAGEASSGAETTIATPSETVTEQPKRGRGRPPKSRSETPSSEGAAAAPPAGEAAQSDPSDKGETAPAAPSETPADRPLTPDDVRAALSEFFSKFGDAPARKVFREYDAFKPGTNTSDENGKARKISELKPEDYAGIIARFRGLIANGLPEGF